MPRRQRMLRARTCRIHALENILHFPAPSCTVARTTSPSATLALRARVDGASPSLSTSGGGISRAGRNGCHSAYSRSSPTSRTTGGEPSWLTRYHRRARRHRSTPPAPRQLSASHRAPSVSAPRLQRVPCRCEACRVSWVSKQRLSTWCTHHVHSSLTTLWCHPAPMLPSRRQLGPCSLWLVWVPPRTWGC